MSYMPSTVQPGQDLLQELLPRLNPDFGVQVQSVLNALLEEGVVMRPYSGMRSPLEQALLWAQSRTPLECELMARRLEEERAPFIAQVLRRALFICMPGRWATNNLPGQSWHSFGMAIDCHVVSEDGRAVWGPKHQAYARYADIAREHGLFPGYDLARQDVVHVQAIAGSVRSVHGPWAVVDQKLQLLFPQDAG